MRPLDKENVAETDKQQLSWIKEKQGLIEEMHNIVDVITQISILLKTSGLSADLALIIPALTSNLSTEEIKNAIDSCSTKKINQWNQANLCESLSIKRNVVFVK